MAFNIGPFSSTTGFFSLFGNRPNQDNVISNLFTNTGQPLPTRENFLVMLEKWASAVSMQDLWLVHMDFPTILNDRILSEWDEQHSHALPNNIDAAKAEVNRTSVTKATGMMLAQGVQIPGESTGAEFLSPYAPMNGMLHGPVSDGSRQLDKLRIEFLETNLSVVDSVMRQWLQLAAHTGYLARSSTDPYFGIRQSIYIFHLARGGHSKGASLLNLLGIGGTDQGLVARKIFIFHDCAPTMVDPQQYVYQEAGAGITRRRVEFSYSRYYQHIPNSTIDFSRGR